MTTTINSVVDLKVGVSVTDKGSLSYQWYKAGDKLSNGEEIAGAAEAVFSPETGSAGLTYYYCVVTNRLGSSVRSVFSPRISVTVKEHLDAASPVIIEQPVNISAEIGGMFTLRTIAYSADGGALSYQWYFLASEDGEAKAVEGATNASYSAEVLAEKLGYYYCVITNTISDNKDGGTKSAKVQTNRAILSNTVVNANMPTIVSQPSNMQVVMPATASFTSKALSLDGGTLSYQWYFSATEDGEPKAVEGATSPTYGFTVSTSNLGYYQCAVTSTIADNKDGGTKSAMVWTDKVCLSATVINAAVPQISLQPQDVSAVMPANATFTVKASSNDKGTISYQWYFFAKNYEDASAITGATGDTYSVKVSPESQGYYYCTVTNEIADNEDGGVKIAAVKTNVVKLSTGIVNAAVPQITVQPQNVSSVMPGSATFSVKATSTDGGTLSYQWYFSAKEDEEPAAISGATQAALSVEVTKATLGYYHCVITNAIADNGDGGKKAETARTNTAVLSNAVVNATVPQITVQPQNVSSVMPGTATFTTKATSLDGGTLSYQWYFSAGEDEDASAISGATKATYSTDVTKATLGRYYCVIKNAIADNGDGGKKAETARTNTAILSNSVINANMPQITVQPQDVSGVTGAKVTLTAGAVSSDGGTLSYQWYFSAKEGEESAAISGATGKAYTAEVSKATLGYYHCAVTNTIADNGDGGKKTATARTTAATLTGIIVNASVPQITVQPQNASGIMSEKITLTAGAVSTDGGTLSYQWYFSAKDGENASAIAGATGKTYTAEVSKGTLGYYYCVVTNTIPDNGDGGKKTATAQTTVSVLSNTVVSATMPQITVQPQNAQVVMPSDATFIAKALSTDGGTLSYQWYFAATATGEGNAIEGATGETYTVAAGKETLGYYYCVITNTIPDNEDGGAKTATAQTKKVILSSSIVNAAVPQITVQPQNVPAVMPMRATFTVEAISSDGGTLSYQWYFSAKDDDTEKAITGATGRICTVDVTTASLGNYYCIITNTITDNGDGGKKTATAQTNKAILSNDIINATVPQITIQPQNVPAVMPQDATFTVDALSTDGGRLSYQWYFSATENGEAVAIAEATGKNCTITVSAEKLGYYYCVITNTITDNGDGGKKTASVQTNKAILSNTVLNANMPVITMQPLDASISIPQGVTFTVYALSTDNGKLSFQWYFSATEDGEAAAIEDATKSSYSVKVSDGTAGYYYCAVTNTITDNGDGGTKSATVHTSKARLTNVIVNADTPMITSQPLDANGLIPAVGVFSVGAYVSDNGTLTYQWYSVSEGKSTGTLVEGATSAKYKAYATTVGKVGYYCVITNTITDNGDGGIKTATAQTETAWFETVYLKNVVPAPVFTTQPSALNIAPYNQGAELTCEAESPGYTVIYKWYESADGTTATGTVIPGADGAAFTTRAFTEKGIYYFYCVATNMLSSEDGLDVKSASVISNVVSVAYTGLPTLYLDTGDTATSAITKDTYVLGNFKMISEDYGTVDYTFKKIKDGVVKEGVKGRGNSSWWNMPKKGYSIKFDSKQSFFGLPKSKKWCIVANYSDKTLLRNKFASVIGTEILNTTWNPKFVSVDVVMNGEYRGNYIFCERISIGDGRIDVQDIADVEENLTAGKENKVTDVNEDGEKNLQDGGFILEVDYPDRLVITDSYCISSKTGKYFVMKDPDEVSDEIKERIETIVQNSEDVLYGADFLDSESGWQIYINTDSVIDWYLVNEFAKNRDAAFGTSVYLYYDPKDEKLHLGPNWDFDIGFGNDGETLCGNTEGWYINTAKWISRMFQDPAFVEKVKSRWNEKKIDLQNAITPSTGTIQRLANQISLSADYNFKRWEILGTYVWPNAAGYAERTTYQSEVDYMINWCNERFNWLDTAISGL